MAGIFGTNGIWSCGFDFLPNGTPAAGGVFSSVAGTPNINASFARFSLGKGMSCSLNSNFVGRTFGTNLVSSYHGFGFLTASLPAPGVIYHLGTWYDTTGVGAQFNLAYNSTGQIGFYTSGGFPNGGTGQTLVSGTSLSATNTIVPNSQMFIEVFNTISTTVGVLTLHINGATVSNFTGLNNRTTADAFVNSVYLGMISNTGASTNHQFDDWYMLDTTGAAPNNTFLGNNGRLQTDGPNADSATGGLNTYSFTTPQGSDFANAANIPANTAQYDFSGVVGDRMSLRFPAFSNVSKVNFLNTWISAEEDAAGVRGVTPIYRSGVTDQVTTEINLSQSYVYYNQNSVINPATGASWFSGTVAAAGACEIGVSTTT